MLTIPVGQALLILLAANKANKNDDKKLKTLYLLGINNDADKLELKKYLQRPELKNYIVSENYETISEDPTRRYFETHFAYLTFTSKLKYLDIEDVRAHYHHLYSMTSDPAIIPAEIKKQVERTFSGNVLSEKIQPEDPEPDPPECHEYSSALKQVAAEDWFKKLNLLHQEKIIKMIKCSYIAVVLVKNYLINKKSAVPMEELYKPNLIYTPVYRGVIKKLEPEDNKLTITDQENKPLESDVKSLHLGLMKSHMPLASTDIAFANHSVDFRRAADQADFSPRAAWPTKLFATLTSPFSNATSGTFLGQLRVIKLLDNQQKLAFKDIDKLKEYLMHYVATLLFMTGGHSLKEYLVPLSIEKVQNNFVHIKGFADLNEQQFYYHDETILNQALDAAFAYNQKILQRAATRDELQFKQFIKKLSTPEPDETFAGFLKNATIVFNRPLSNEQLSLLSQRLNTFAKEGSALIAEKTKCILKESEILMRNNLQSCSRLLKETNFTDPKFNELSTYYHIAFLTKDDTLVKQIQSQALAAINDFEIEHVFIALANLEKFDLYASLYQTPTEAMLKGVMEMITNKAATLKVIGLETKSKQFLQQACQKVLEKWLDEYAEESLDKDGYEYINNLIMDFKQYNVFNALMADELHNFILNINHTHRGPQDIIHLLQIAQHIMPSTPKLINKLKEIVKLYGIKEIEISVINETAKTFSDMPFINKLLERAHIAIIESGPSEKNIIEFAAELKALDALRKQLPNHQFTTQQLAPVLLTDTHINFNQLSANAKLMLVELYRTYDFYRPAPTAIQNILNNPLMYQTVKGELITQNSLNVIAGKTLLQQLILINDAGNAILNDTLSQTKNLQQSPFFKKNTPSLEALKHQFVLILEQLPADTKKNV